MLILKEKKPKFFEFNVFLYFFKYIGNLFFIINELKVIIIHEQNLKNKIKKEFLKYLLTKMIFDLIFIFLVNEYKGIWANFIYH